MSNDPSEPTDLGSTESPDNTIRLEPETTEHRIEASGESFEGVIGLKDQASPESLAEETFEGDNKKQHVSVRLISFLVAAFIILLIGSLTIIQHYRRATSTKTTPDSLKIPQIEKSDDSLVTDQDATRIRKQIIDAAIGFVSAPSVEERYKFSRKYPGLKERMEDFYSKRQFYNSPLLPENIRILEPTIVDGIRMFDVVVFWAGIGKVPIPVCVTSEGFLVDWEAVQVWQPFPLKDFLNGKIEGSAGFRVEVQPDDFYISPYGTRQFISLRLTGSRIKHPVYAYLERGSKAERDCSHQLASWRSGDHRPFKMILELEFDRNVSRSSIVEIVGVQASSWLRPAPDTDSP